MYYSWIGTVWSLSGHFGFNLKPMASTNISQRDCYGNTGLFCCSFFPLQFWWRSWWQTRGSSRKEIWRGCAYHLRWRSWTKHNFQFSQGWAISVNWKMTQTGTNAKSSLSNKVIDKARLTSHLAHKQQEVVRTLSLKVRFSLSYRNSHLKWKLLDLLAGVIWCNLQACLIHWKYQIHWITPMFILRVHLSSRLVCLELELHWWGEPSC